jgi:hypothetical protein
MNEVFEEVHLRFLVVGHMHEDIDGNFGYLSKKLKEQNNCVSEFDENIYGFARNPFILQLIQKI